MSTPYARAKVVGNKKQLVNKNNTIEKIYSHAISKAIADGSASDSKVFNKLLSDHLKTGGKIQACDSRTGETFFHVLSKYAHHYVDAKTVRIFYEFGIKIDLDAEDHLGDTVLHKICLVPGAWRCIVAVLRCAASPFIKNKLGFTAEEIILQQKRDRWEENLYWLKKFTPGLWFIPKDIDFDKSNCLAERFLKSWCRTSKIFGDKLISLKSHCLVEHLELFCVVMMEKYEITNEAIIAMLSGSMDMLNTIMESDAARKVNVDTMDHFYQYSYRDSPTAPRPLLVAVWETENYEMVKRLMALGPNTSVKYTFEAESCSPPKPLFFHLVNPRSRPESLEITITILQGSDLTLRNEKGETILFEAIYNNETESVIRAILDCGVDIAARDLKGRTATDVCILQERNDYKGLIDSHVIKLVTDLNVPTVENLVLHMYDHFPNDCMTQLSKLPKSDRQIKLLHILKNIHNMQASVKKLFALTKDGNFTKLWKTLTTLSPQSVCACDKAGRSLLHFAVQSSNKDPSDETSEDITDNVGTICIEKSNKQIESIPDTDKLQPNLREKKCHVTDLFSRKNLKPDFLGIINHLVKVCPTIVDFTNNLGQTALHTAYIYSANKPVLDALDKAGHDDQVEDIFGYVPTDYNRDLSGEQTYQCRRKPVDEMDLNIFLTESEFEFHLKKALQTGQTCHLKCLVSSLVAHGGLPYYNHVLFDCLDANMISLAKYLIQKGFQTNISKQYDVCNPDNPMCAMMECSHAVTTLLQRAKQVGATDVITLMNERTT